MTAETPRATILYPAALCVSASTKHIATTARIYYLGRSSEAKRCLSLPSAAINRTTYIRTVGGLRFANTIPHDPDTGQNSPTCRK